jgi:tetratricopeptide (TPR) repeat protein
MSDIQSTEDVPEAVTLGVAATERGDYEAALQVFRHVYQLVPPESAPLGLSSYGLCLAKVEKKNKMGAELCQKAIDLQFYEGRHWANLVRVYIAGKNRRKAVEVLEKGLKKMRNDRALVRVREEIGYRKAPYFRSLRRQHPLNKLYSRSAAKLKRRAKAILLVIASIIYLAMCVALFFLILK